MFQWHRRSAEKRGLARRFGLESAAFAIGKPCESVIPGSQMRDVITQGRPILLDMQDTPKEPLVVMRLPILFAVFLTFVVGRMLNRPPVISALARGTRRLGQCIEHDVMLVLKNIHKAQFILVP